MLRRAKTLPLAIGAGLLVASAGVHALGFGQSSTVATLGQRLNITVGLRQDESEFVDVECVSAEVRTGDNRVPPQNVRVTIEGAPGDARRLIRVSTTTVIDEPIVTIKLAVGCPPSVSREFVALADPPVVQLAAQAPEPTPPAAAAPSAPPQRAEAEGVTTARAPAVAAPKPAAPATPRRRAPRPSSATVRAPSQQVARPAGAAGPAVAAPVQRGPAPEVRDRLRLDAARLPAPPPQPASAPPPGVVEAAAADQAASAAAVAAAAASAASAAEAARAADVERLRALEESLAKLREEMRGSTQELTALQARVQRAEAERYANPVVYALAGLSAVLAMALGAALFRRSREREARWWAHSQPARLDEAGRPSRIRNDSPAESVPSSVLEPVSGVEVDEITSQAPMPTVSPATRPAVSEARREVTVEELIDLEQQAEFFIVLGQDESAIDLLMNHLRNTGGISPLPYLKLLEIYRRRGERSPYERLRERFNRRFNAYAPDWEADPAAGRSLEDYPEVIVRLQAAWSQPQRAMEELESMLFRRDEGETFDVPAYGEVLFLYSLARDLLDHPGREPVPGKDVDLLLPLGGGDASSTAAVSPMVSTMSMEPSPMVEKPISLDLDVSMPAPLDALGEPRPARTDRVAGTGGSGVQAGKPVPGGNKTS